MISNHFIDHKASFQIVDKISENSSILVTDVLYKSKEFCVYISALGGLANVSSEHWRALCIMIEFPSAMAAHIYCQ